MDAMQTTTAPSSSSDAKSVLLLVNYIIPIVFIYTMISKGENPFFVGHAKNAAGYLVLAIALNIVFQILWNVIPSLVGTLAMLMNLLFLVLFVMVMYFGAYAAWQGKTGNIPVVSMIGAKIPLEKWFKKGTVAPAPAAATPAPMASSPTPAPEAPAPVSAPTPAPEAPVSEPAAPVAPSAPTETPMSDAGTTPPTEGPAAPQA